MIVHQNGKDTDKQLFLVFRENIRTMSTKIVSTRDKRNFYFLVF